MSFTITCPICGPRSAYEFRYGEVERGPRPPEEGMTPEKWIEYVYLRPNLGGVQQEWWYHRDGCGSWFTIRRSTLTNLEVDNEEVGS
jgi:heterotetrameric sarcosine oxidase delta subunit